MILTESGALRVMNISGEGAALWPPSSLVIILRQQIRHSGISAEPEPDSCRVDCLIDAARQQAALQRTPNSVLAF